MMMVVGGGSDDDDDDEKVLITHLLVWRSGFRLCERNISKEIRSKKISVVFMLYSISETHFVKIWFRDYNYKTSRPRL